jgi:MFS family permease
LPSKSELNSRSIFLAFWAAYLLSYLFRTINAVVSPELTRDLGLAPGTLGLLTSAYFVAFAAVQLPAGVLLDRFGPRRVEPALLAVGGTGALLFAYAESTTGLVIARALIGAGVAVCLMAPLKAIAAWVPRERQASFAGWVMTAGSAGALLAATTTEFALRFVHWRTLFLALACTTSSLPPGSGGACPTRGSQSKRPDSGRSGRVCASCSCIRGSGGSRRSRAAAPARSSRSRDSGRCPGSPKSTATIAASRRDISS